ncbi:hypothetical protein QAD02_015443 [Eretmocerus hayati]|uniref:Uncharacterized protein n=1 Tax=Eretmocerus hayati TaxID=131215 RepID=A0ACC2P896_9HYME|nr:hypothetical protein QAD02_015443 [Eretmocerus hayati]
MNQNENVSILAMCVSSILTLIKVVQFHCHHNIDFYAVDHRGRTPLLAAFKNRKYSGYYPKKVQNISSLAKNEAGYTSLHLAVENMRVNAVEQLLTSGADPRRVNATGQTPLHLDCKDYLDGKKQTTKSEIVDLLLKHGADVNARDSKNSIHYADSLRIL